MDLLCPQILTAHTSPAHETPQSLTWSFSAHVTALHPDGKLKGMGPYVRSFSRAWGPWRMCSTDSVRKVKEQNPTETPLRPFLKFKATNTYGGTILYRQFVRAVLGLQQNWEAGTEISKMYPLPPHKKHVPIMTTTGQYGAFATKDEPTLTQSPQVYGLAKGSFLVLHVQWV